MFKITLPENTITEIQNELIEMKNIDMLSTFTYMPTFLFQMQINGKQILHPELCYHLYIVLRRLNNACYTSFLDDNVDIRFGFSIYRGNMNDYFRIIRPFSDGMRQVEVSGKKGSDFICNFSEICDFFQLAEEVNSAVNQFKDVCFSAVKQISPQNPLKSMAEIFGKEENYTMNIQDEIRFDTDHVWLPLDSLLKEIKSKNKELLH